MNLLIVSIDFISIFLFMILFLFFVCKVVKKVGLVDKLNFCKCYQGLIFFVGGILVYVGICFMFGIVDYYILYVFFYFVCVGVFVFIGVLDDCFDISVKICVII